jgi:hypothetical protein
MHGQKKHQIVQPNVINIPLPPWLDSPQWTGASSMSRLRDPTQTHTHTQSAGLLWANDKVVADTST